MVVIRGVTGGTNMPGARSTRGASTLLRVARLMAVAMRRAFRRGADMLRELKALQLELLEGRADPARLQELIRLTQGEKPADPGLAEALEAIALRARLELARRGMEA